MNQGRSRHSSSSTCWESEHHHPSDRSASHPCGRGQAECTARWGGEERRVQLRTRAGGLLCHDELPVPAPPLSTHPIQAVPAQFLTVLASSFTLGQRLKAAPEASPRTKISQWSPQSISSVFASKQKAKIQHLWVGAVKQCSHTSQPASS